MMNRAIALVLFAGSAPKSRPRQDLAIKVLLCVLLFSFNAFAHKGSDAYWNLRATDTVVSGRLDVALEDLNILLPLDGDDDGKLTWGEIRAHQQRLRSTLQNALKLNQNSEPCPLELGALNLIEHSDGVYLAISTAARCPQHIEELEVSYDLLFDVDAQHRGLLSLAGQQGNHWVAFTSNRRTHVVTFTSINSMEQLRIAVTQGIHHIAIGWDHLCFLFALLLPSVLRRTNNTWEVRAEFKPTLIEVTKVVTAFTVAHSITLGLAAFGVVTPNAHWVEVAIALSVALAAFNNLVPFVAEARWSLAFSLGLMHGFGFVSAIQDLGEAGPSLWLSVFGFNLGVEVGQLAIVCLFVPLAWFLRQKKFYRSVVLPLGSASILGVALLWTTQRL